MNNFDYGNVDRCVLCGEIVPEGTMVCPLCIEEPMRVLQPRENKKKNKSPIDKTELSIQVSTSSCTS